VAPADDLLRYFQELSARHGAVRLLNTYRGIPVIHPAAVQSVNQGYVVVEIHPHQAACMSLEGKTHLFPDNGSPTLQARVVAVEMLRSQAILAEFKRANASIGKRLTVRVQPNAPIDVLLYDGENRVSGKLADISTSGMGIAELNTHIFNPVTWEPGQGVYVDFKVTPEGEILRFKGKIVNLVPSRGMPLQRVGMTIEARPPAREALQDYIAMRQAETLEELHNIHEMMCRQQGLRR
jgi:hypothetical protein